MAVFITRSTLNVDTTPNAFSFTDQTNVSLSSTITSAAITVSGINSPATITVSGGTYDINSSGSFTSSPGTVNNGDTVRARHTSSGSNSTATNTVVTIGGVSDTFTSTTEAAASSALFYDDMSTGSLSGAQNGISWGAQNIGSGDGSISVVAGAGYGGAYGLRFRFAAGDTGRHVEQRMNFGNGIFTSAFWMRYYYLCPTNRLHPSGGPIGDNDKFWLAIWGGDYNSPSTPGLTLNAWPNGNNTSYITANYFNGNGFSGHAWQASTFATNALTVADRGQWMRLVFAWELPANSGDYGRCRIWKDAGVTGSYTKLLDCNSNDVTINDVRQGSNYMSGQSYLTEAYLMGYRNSNNANQEDHIISHVEIHTSNIFGVS